MLRLDIGSGSQRYEDYTTVDQYVSAVKWESVLAFVAAASALDRAIKQHGLMSNEAKEAQRYADAKMREYKRWRLK
jgi:hypothetical protein